MSEEHADAGSILSHGERAVARHLREGRSVEEIADERDAPVETVEKAVDRIRTKTDRALATLAQSPFATEAARELDEATRERVRAALTDE